mmetsp:Transcript_2607/g.5657  ORF Transcript_2607/g.5657 Transcript_2607/m.5657 type:complete len:314 (+) Transcript_2607:122-1063(+)
MMPQTTTQIVQILCQKYGWGFIYGADEVTGDWILDIFYGIGECKRFIVPIPRGAKHGKAIVSEAALMGLKEITEHEESKRLVALKDIFPDPITVYDSCSESTWERFWNDSPTEVGVDCEGNSISPPVLVQISTENYTILEVPLNGRLSDNLQQLLETDSIVKIFCDNFSNRDKKCLGLNIEFGEGNITNEYDKQRNKLAENNYDNSRCTKPNVVDIEILATDVIGPTKTPRGLSKLLCLCFPEMNVRIEKSGKSMKQKFKHIGKFVQIERGKAEPLTGLCDLNDNQQQYAALDSWCTLKVYQRMRSILEKKEE